MAYKLESRLLEDINLRYVGDSTLMSESKKELKPLWQAESLPPLLDSDSEGLGWGSKICPLTSSQVGSDEMSRMVLGDSMAWRTLRG